MLSPVTPLWCLLIAGIMPYSVLFFAKSSKEYDNEDPRNMKAYQTPVRRRAHAAHQNSFEAFGLFAAAVLLALFQHVAPTTLSGLTILWVLLRVLYFVMYLTGKSTLRSLVWVAATATSIAIFLEAIFV
jgi:uncharacterized MAPEG superfamily protein